MSDILSERRRRFLEQKAVHGNIENIIKAAKEIPYKLYFDHTGYITCLTNDHSMEVDPEWLTYDFTAEQLNILHKQGTRNFRVQPDAENAFVYQIVPKKTAAVSVNAELEFLYPVEDNGISADVIVALRPDKFTVAISDSVKESYHTNDITTHNVLYFYITAPCDPHFLFQSVEIPLTDLLNNTVVEIETSDDFSKCAVYTKKIFTTYTRNHIKKRVNTQ